MNEPLFKNKQKGIALGDLLKNNNFSNNTIFNIFTNIDAISTTVTPPKTRKEANVGYKDDASHQRGLQILINKKLIQNNSLILSDTGHDIPLAAQLLKNKQFKSQTLFYLPHPLIESPGTYDRLIHQAQSWGEDIAHYLKRNQSNESDIIFIGLEGHRRDYDKSFLYTIPWYLFPNEKELLKLGTERIIYITEAHPDNPSVIEKVLPDVKQFLNTIKTLPIFYYGVDCRRDNGC